MDAIAKLLKKMSRRDKEHVLAVLEEIRTGGVSGSNLQGQDAYRVRIGMYHIIYHT
jgi:mRNA-degrading endonuclease RelE of RelBE toxin-antitoxin system